MSETIDVEEWIYDKLTEDAALSALITDVYSHPAPEEAEYPFITIDQEGGEDANSVGGVRMLTHVNYLIRVIGKNCGRKALQPAVDRMDALLVGDRSGVIACERESPFAMREIEEGISYAHLGGIYHFVVS